MHSHSLESWQHEHVFLGERHEHNERRTLVVVGLTAATMIVEIVGGTVFGSMALVADGWHMSTHAAALGIAAFAYRFARHHARDDRFTFGTGKFGELAGYSSALILAMIAVLIGYESVLRMFQPVTIHYAEASAIAVLGLLVNLASAWLLQDEHHHEHVHESEHGTHHHHDHDHNLAVGIHACPRRCIHVGARDNSAALWLGLWLDVDGRAGRNSRCGRDWELVVGLLRASGAVLLDAIPNAGLARAIRQRIEVGERSVRRLASVAAGTWSRGGCAVDRF